MNSIFKILVFTLCFLSLSPEGLAQDYKSNTITLRARTAAAIPTITESRRGTSFSFSSAVLRTMWDDFNIVSFKEAYPAAKHFDHPLAEPLSRVYEVTCDCNDTELRNFLKTNATEYYDRVDFVAIPETLGESFASCLPNDEYQANWQNWHLEQIGALDAWCMTTGNANGKIAILEPGNLDANHEDLVDNLLLVNNNGGSNLDHATQVTGYASASTNNVIGIASVGYNSKILFYGAGGSNALYNAILQATLDGATVINNSWRVCGYNQNAQDIIHIANGLGTVVIAASANGNYARNCDEVDSGVGYDPDVHGYAYPASYDGVISVTGTSKSKRFETGDCCNGLECNEPEAMCMGQPCPPTIVSTYNDRVDIAAPAFCTYTTYPNNSYGIGYRGTSFAAPMVAGAVALMQSVNPNLCPYEIEEILKSTAEDISGIPGYVDPNGNYTLNANSVYTNFHPVGLLDVDAAVDAAFNFQGSNITHNINTGQTVTWSNQTIESDNITVHTGATLIIDNGSVVRISGGGKIHVLRGAKLIIDNSTITARCGMWDGILVDGRVNRPQPQSTTVQTFSDAGIVHIKNQSTIELAKTAVASVVQPNLPHPEIYNRTGGLVIAENSSFVFNITVGRFDKYLYPNNSRFIGCTFSEAPNSSNTTVSNTEVTNGFLIDQTDGIRFNACQFINFDRSGIRAQDAVIKVEENNQFSNMVNGIELYGTLAASPVEKTIIGEVDGDGNTFLNCLYPIRLSSTAFYYDLEIANNTFEDATVGILIEGPTQYYIYKNAFRDMYNGIEGYDTGSFTNEVRCNEFGLLSRGIYMFGANDNFQFQGNQFSTFEGDFYLEQSGSGASGKIRIGQGGLGDPANNCFSTNHTSHIITGGNTQTFYYYLPYTDVLGCLLPQGGLNSGGSNNFYVISTYQTEEDCTEPEIGIGFRHKANDQETLDTELTNDFRLSPNPANDRLRIQCNAHPEDIEVIIFNLNGVALGRNLLARGQTSLDLATDHLSAGLYVLAFRNEKGNTLDRKKLLIAR